MKIQSILLTTLTLGLATLIVGCEVKPRQAPQPRIGAVALIDLDEVAKRLGRDVAIATELKSTSETLSTKLGAVQTDFQSKFNESRKAIGENLTDADKQNLALLERKLNTEFQQKQQEAQGELNSKRIALITRFREEVKPIAQEIASSRGLDVVLIKSEALVLGSESSVDVTDAVVAKMIAMPSAPVTSSALPTPPTTKTP